MVVDVSMNFEFESFEVSFYDMCSMFFVIGEFGVCMEFFVEMFECFEVGLILCFFDNVVNGSGFGSLRCCWLGIYDVC